MTAPAGSRDLAPGIALSLACGRVLIGRPQDADRDGLVRAIAAVPDVDSAARGLAQVAAAWLAGGLDNHALAVALANFNAPFCANRRPDPAQRGADDMPLFAPATHAARVAQALED